MIANTLSGGTDPRKGNARFLALEANPGGWGAFSTGAGQDVLINEVNGPFKDLPVVQSGGNGK